MGKLRQWCGIPAVPDAVLAVGAAFFILFSNDKINLFNTYTLLIIAGVIKYIPFASRSALNSMLQLSGEIEEAAIIQDIPLVQADAADHHSDPEVFHYQRIYASVHDLSARAVPVLTAMYAGLYPLHDTGLFR